MRPIYKLLDLLESEVDDAASWTHASWTHELEDSEGYVRNADGDPLYCEGGQDGCSTCNEVALSAAEAARLGREAVAAARRGDWDHGATLIEEAREQEAQWGDDPSWRHAAATYTSAHEAVLDLLSGDICQVLSWFFYGDRQYVTGARAEAWRRDGRVAIRLEGRFYAAEDLLAWVLTWDRRWESAVALGDPTPNRLQDLQSVLTGLFAGDLQEILSR